MSEPGEDRMLAEYLGRGTEVSRRYRELDAGDVPPALDRRVLDQARSAVTKSRAWMRWSAPLAIAASALLVVSIVIETGVDEDAVLTMPSPAAEAPADKQVQAASPPAADERVRGNAAPRDTDVGADSPMLEAVEAEAKRRSPLAADAATPVTVVPFEPAPVAPPAVPMPRSASPEPSEEATAIAPQAQGALAKDASEDSARQSERELRERALVDSRTRTESAASAKSEARRVAQPAAQPSYESVVEASSDAQAAEEADTQSVDNQSASQSGAALSAPPLPNPELWLESIRELRRDGKNALADREWLRFREVFPEYPVTEEDPARKPGTR